ncbi:MAG: DMT family transporter [Promethearchaeota archaeon]
MKESLKGYLLCFFGVFSWSFSEITVRVLHLNGSVGPISLSFYRFFFGGLFLLLLMFLRREIDDIKKLLKRNQKLLIISSMVGLGVSNMIYFLGVTMTRANVASALYTTYPIFISIYGIFLLNERSNMKLKGVGFVIGFFGTAILLTNFDFSLFINPELILGNLLLVIAAAIWGFYSVLGKIIFKRNPGIDKIEIKFTAVSFFYACIPILFILFFSGDELSTFFQHAPVEWLLIFLMAFFITAIGLYAFFTGVKYIEVSKGISLALLKPVLATIFAAMFLPQEAIPASLLVSMPIIFIAVILINKK